MKLDRKISDTIDEIVREHMKLAKIISVRAKESTDWWGDPILSVTVVFDTKGGRIDAAAANSLGRHVRAELAKLHDDRFPVFEFVSAEEAGRARASA